MDPLDASPPDCYMYLRHEAEMWELGCLAERELCAQPINEDPYLGLEDEVGKLVDQSRLDDDELVWFNFSATSTSKEEFLTGPASTMAVAPEMISPGSCVHARLQCDLDSAQNEKEECLPGPAGPTMDGAAEILHSRCKLELSDPGSSDDDGESYEPKPVRPQRRRKSNSQTRPAPVAGLGTAPNEEFLAGSSMDAYAAGAESPHSAPSLLFDSDSSDDDDDASFKPGPVRPPRRRKPKTRSASTSTTSSGSRTPLKDVSRRRGSRSRCTGPAALPPNAFHVPSSSTFKTKTPTTMVQCGLDGCTHRCRNAADLRRHRESLAHAPEKQYPCPGCPGRFTRQDALKRHMAAYARCREPGMGMLRDAWLETEEAREVEAERGAPVRVVFLKARNLPVPGAGKKARSKRKAA
ncbi:hypothetical protein C8R46DRAFT_1186044 [Mycena filopes]|nr:hypothetical protein C8R46DRAFT_1186044 [Mycena filopes]